jgi:hypothetical protein
MAKLLTLESLVHIREVIVLILELNDPIHVDGRWVVGSHGHDASKPGKLPSHKPNQVSACKGKLWQAVIGGR